MTSTFNKLAYCLVLMTLAMFVAMPRHTTSLPAAEIAAAPLSTEGRLAKAIHARIAVEVAGELPADRLTQLAAEEDGLRQLAFAADADNARQQLIDCLADELSAAMLQRSTIAARPNEDHTRREKMAEVVRALTAAINAEVRGISA